MKKSLLVLALGVGTMAAHAQSVGIGTTTPNSSSVLDVVSTNKGVLLPRLGLQSVSDAVTIASPATGLIVYNTNSGMPAGTGLYYNSGTPAAPQWLRMLGINGGSAPITGQTVLWNGTSYVTGNPAIILAPGTTLSGNGTSTSPITINPNAAVYNSNRIQSKDVSTTAPTNGQTLIWNSALNQYVPGTVAGDNWGSQTVNVTGPAITGDGTVGMPITFTGISTTGTPLSGVGTLASPLTINTGAPIYNANKIQGGDVSTTAPSVTQVLVWNGTQYVPGPVNATLIQNKVVNPTAPTNGQVLVFNSTTNQYAPGLPAGDNWGTQTAAVSGPAISGNGSAANPLTVNNTAPIFNANQINNTNVTGGTPTTGQTLIFNGTSYSPGMFTLVTSGTNLSGGGTTVSPLTFTGINIAGSPLSGNGTSTSPLSVNAATNIYNANKIQNTNVSITAPTNGQTLVYNSTTNTYTPATPAGDNWGSQTVSTSGPALTGNGTTATPLTVNNTAAIFNANQINNTPVTGTPTTGQTLIFNGTSYAPTSLSLVTQGTNLSGAGTTASPLTFTGINTTGAPLSGNGTSTSPLSINTGTNVYNSNKIQNINVSTTIPVNGQTLVYNSTTNTYTPAAPAGDNWGTQTTSVTGPALTGNGTAASPITSNTSLNVYNSNKIQNINVSTTAPVNGQTLVYNSTTNTYTPGTAAGDNWGSQTTSVTGPALTGNGTSGSPLTVNTGINVYNSSKIQNTNVSTTTPTNGQTLVFNSTTNQYTPGNPTPAVKVLALTSGSEQDLDNATMNSGNHQKITFSAANDIDANFGSSVTFNEANQDFTIAETGAYAIDGYFSYTSGGACGTHPISYAVKKNGVITTGARMVYTNEMCNADAETRIQGLSFHNVLYLVPGDVLTLWIKKPSGANPPDPRIKKSVDIPESKRFSITKL